MGQSTQFDWEGKNYSIPLRAFDGNLPIRLPGGTCLRVSRWDVTKKPPAPKYLYEISVHPDMKFVEATEIL